MIQIRLQKGFESNVVPQGQRLAVHIPKIECLLPFSVVISDLEQNKLPLKNMHISGSFTGVFLSFTGKSWDN